MNDAEERFAARITEDLEHVVGPAMVVDDVELLVGDDAARVTATLRIGDRAATIEAVGRDVLSLYQPLIRQAAETRLALAYRAMLTTEGR